VRAASPWSRRKQRTSLSQFVFVEYAIYRQQHDIVLSSVSSKAPSS
jgi:hypothetical protein